MSGELKAHREYLDGCSKRAASKYQALLAVAKAARAVCSIPCSCEEGFTARGLHASQWCGVSASRIVPPWLSSERAGRPVRVIVVTESPERGFDVIASNLIEAGSVVASSRDVREANRTCVLMAMSQRVRAMPLESAP